MQLNTSSTVIEKGPANNPVAISVVCPLFQEYVYPLLPPTANTVASPSLSPLQVTDVDKVVNVIPRGSEMEVTVIDVQRLASETVTLYEPAGIPLKTGVVIPESQR